MTRALCRDLSVVSIESGGGDLYTVRLEHPGWGSWLPGQFVMLRRENPRPDCLWARPFSIADVDGDSLRLVFQVAGRETRELAACTPGERLTVWGPLGNGFSVETDAPTLLLAGGIGLAPFVGYVRNHPAPERLRLEFGHRLPLECYPFTDCAGPDCRVAAQNHPEECAADLAAFISMLEERIRETAGSNGLVLACGPMPFLRTVHRFAMQYGARAELSLETRMACGIGACLGCVVKGRPRSVGAVETPPAFGFTQTCTSGPVFRAEDLDLEATA